MEKVTKSAKQTRVFARNFASEFKGQIITLSGELGTGKTTFVQGLAKGFGIKDKIISPTFVLMRQHKIPNSFRTLPAGRQVLYHIDLYRLEDKSSISNLGLDDLFSDPNAIIVIEWPEKLNKLPKKATIISIEKIDANIRKFIIHNS